MNRPVGAYWVWTTTVGPLHYRGKWIAATWDGQYWLLPGVTGGFTDNDFDRITAPITEPWSGFEQPVTFDEVAKAAGISPEEAATIGEALKS